MAETPYPQRRHPAHFSPIERKNQSLIIMLTVCAKDRHRVLSTPQFHAALRASWQAADFWLVGRYVIMPDHLHLFCTPGTVTTEPLTKWVRFWKSSMTKTMSLAPGILWQSDFWDTQLRHGDSYSEKWHYVLHNPVRAGLVSSPELWPYQGEMNVLHWYD